MSTWSVKALVCKYSNWLALSTKMNPFHYPESLRRYTYWGKDVDTSAIVAEAALPVSVVGGTNGEPETNKQTNKQQIVKTKQSETAVHVMSQLKTPLQHDLNAAMVFVVQ